MCEDVMLCTSRRNALRGIFWYLLVNMDHHESQGRPGGRLDFFRGPLLNPTSWPGLPQAENLTPSLPTAHDAGV